MSTGAFTEIPLIDLGPYFAGDRAGKRRVAEEISRACERIGFFLVSGHGVDPALCEQARRESMAFFELSLEEKLAIRRQQDDLSVRGYEPLGTEHLSATIGVETPPDLKESISFGPLEVPDHPSCHAEAAAPCYAPNIWPSHPASLRHTIEAYIRGPGPAGLAPAPTRGHRLRSARRSLRRKTREGIQHLARAELSRAANGAP